MMEPAGEWEPVPEAVPPRDRGGYAFAKIVRCGDVYSLRTSSLVLGRGATNDKSNFYGVSASQRVSRQHAVISFDEVAGEFKAKCLSKNGMKVGGAILMPESAPVALPSKTLLFIGDTHLYWLLPEDVYERHRRSRGKCRFVLAEQSELLLQRKRPRAMTHAELAPAACAVVKSALAERRMLSTDDLMQLVASKLPVSGPRWQHAVRAALEADPELSCAPVDEAAGSTGELWALSSALEPPPEPEPATLELAQSLPLPMVTWDAQLLGLPPLFAGGTMPFAELLCGAAPPAPMWLPRGPG